MTALPRDVRRIFADALKKNISATEGQLTFRKNAFFDCWFKRLGTPLLFLFKKNLYVTNMQFAELAALVRSTACDDTGDRTDLQFASPQTFINSLASLVDSFLHQAKKDAAGVSTLVADLYSDIMRSLVVLSPHFNSCEVFLPINLTVDLEQICGYAGYIHSCGYNVYLRNTTKASYQSFRDALVAHLTSCRVSSRRVRLIVYSHEDFSRLDFQKQSTSRLAHGLEEDKLHIEKMYLGDQRLVSALRNLRTDPEIKDRIEIPRAGGRVPEFSETDKTHSLFLIRDHSIGRHPGSRGDEVYLILYDQLYKNINQFHYFDENKPAWVTHTTTPHTLIGAMINLTRPAWPAQVSICDPFAGTGTSILESCKFGGVQLFGRDASPLVTIVAEDNRQLFSATKQELEEYRDFLEKGVKGKPGISLKRESPDFFSTLIQVQGTFFEIFAKEGVLSLQESDDGGEALERELAAALRGVDKFQRMLFYLMLKTLRRNEGALHRETLEEEWEPRFLAEVEQLARDVEVLITLYSREALRKKGNILIVQDDYSLACAVAPDVVAGERGDIRVQKVEDLEQDAYDVIVADPPYGFNTEESVEELARLYNIMIRKLIESLREGGQLVITLPERSYIGRRSPFFTHKEIVSQIILREAYRRGLEMMKASVPEPGALFRPPYYWRAERALSRSILHFRFRSRQAG